MMEPKAAQRQVLVVTAARGMPGLRKDRRVHEDDVRHRDEGGEASEDLGAPGGLVLVEFKVGFCAFNKP